MPATYPIAGEANHLESLITFGPHCMYVCTVLVLYWYSIYLMQYACYLTSYQGLALTRPLTCQGRRHLTAAKPLSD